MRNKLLLIAGLWAGMVSGQAGSNDPTFNPLDIGSGHLANNAIEAMAVQADGDIVIGGRFTTYDNVARAKVARIHTDGTLDMSFDPGTGIPGIAKVKDIALQSDGKVLIVGDFSTYNGTASRGIARLNSDGSLDTAFAVGTGFSLPVYYCSVASVSVLPDGKLLVGGNFPSYNGTARANLVRLNPDGSLDPAFNPSGAGPLGSALNTVNCIEQLADGKLLIGGQFSSYNGTTRINIARLLADGTLDPDFHASVNGPVRALLINSNGRILVGGYFRKVNGTTRVCLALLNPNGHLVADYNPGALLGYQPSVNALLPQGGNRVVVGGFFNPYRGAPRSAVLRVLEDGTLDTVFDWNGRGGSREIYAMAQVADGKLLIAGQLDRYNRISVENLARLYDDGSLDPTFARFTGPNGPVHGLALYPDGRMMIAVEFAGSNLVWDRQLARLTPDGALDPTFQKESTQYGGVRTLAIQADGKILAGGKNLSKPDGSRNALYRYNADGTADETFTAGFTGSSAYVSAIAIQPDGKILLAGQFSLYGGVARNGLVRVNSDGTIDPTFVPPTSASYRIVYAISLQPDGGMVIGGDFSYIGTQTGSHIARLLSDGTLDPTFNPGTGLDMPTEQLLVQPDGKILLAGPGTMFNGTPVKRLFRINGDGTLDTGFDSGDLVTVGTVSSLAMQADGKILVAGDYSSSESYGADGGLARLFPDGSKDPDFQVSTSANNIIRQVAIQSEGRAIIAGDFKRYNGAKRYSLARVVLDAGDGLNPQEERRLEAATTNGLWPNPTYGTSTHLLLSGLDPSAHFAQVQLVDLTGKVLSRTEFPVVDGRLDTELEFANTSDGMYLLHIVAGADVRTERLVIRR